MVGMASSGVVGTSRASGRQWERILAPATECPRIRASFLEEERRTMGERWFRREYLCEFEDSGSSVFGRDLVERAITELVEPLLLGTDSVFRGFGEKGLSVPELKGQEKKNGRG